MSDQDQCCETPLLELARNVPIDLRGEWEIQWADDGTPTGHAMAPVGSYVHRLADELEAALTKLDNAESMLLDYDKKIKKATEECNDWRKLSNQADARYLKALDRLGSALDLIRDALEHSDARIDTVKASLLLIDLCGSATAVEGNAPAEAEQETIDADLVKEMQRVQDSILKNCRNLDAVEQKALRDVAAATEHWTCAKCGEKVPARRGHECAVERQLTECGHCGVVIGEHMKDCPELAASIAARIAEGQRHRKTTRTG